MRHTLLAIALCLAVGSAYADDDISHVNGSITVEAGQQRGDLETVNGGIHVETGAKAKDIETVNGGISLSDDAQVGAVSTVNGGITAGERVTITGDASTVNGGIRVDFHSKVSGEVSTVNGGISIHQTDIGGRIHTINGDITIGASSQVHGGILVEKPNKSGWNWGFGKPKIPLIVIGPNAVVDGELRFEREVELYVHTSAKIGTVSGATPIPYTDSIPARR